MNLINAGELRHEITLQQRVVTPKNALGQAGGGWADVVTVRASVDPLRGRELFAAGQTLAPVEVRVRLRYITGVTPAMRFMWDGVAYGISSVINVAGLCHTLEIMATSALRDTQ